MHKIDTPGAAKEMPVMQHQGEPGWFHEGGAGRRPTKVGAEWFNMVQAELLNVLNDAGIEPNKLHLNQLLTAIKMVSAVATTKGIKEHINAENPHEQYMTSAVANTTIATAITAHQLDDEAHPSLMTGQQARELMQLIINQHQDADNPHSQYTTTTEVNNLVKKGIDNHIINEDAHPNLLTALAAATLISNALTTHREEDDPHKNYIKQGDVESAINHAFSAHLNDIDAHSQYATKEECESSANSAASAAIAAHAQEVDPHSQYVTAEAAETTAQAMLTSHEAEVNPHEQYATKEECKSSADSAATAAVNEHVTSQDAAHNASSITVKSIAGVAGANVQAVLEVIAAQQVETSVIEWRVERASYSVADIAQNEFIYWDLTGNDIAIIHAQYFNPKNRYDTTGEMFIEFLDANNVAVPLSMEVSMQLGWSEKAIFIPPGTAKIKVMNNNGSAGVRRFLVRRITRLVGAAFPVLPQAAANN